MKKFILPLLLVAAAMSSCLKDEIMDVYVTSDDPDVISLDLSSASTKGTELTAALLRNGYADDAGINITMYYTTGTTYGSIVFDYAGTGSGWLQTAATPLKWSELDLPVTFYSMITSTGSTGAENYTLSLAATDTSAALPEAFEVRESSIESHEDLIMSTTTVSKAPTGGTFNAIYDHAVSKADVRIKTNDVADATDLGNEVIILKANFRNLVNTGEAAISNAGTISWDLDGYADADTYTSINDTEVLSYYKSYRNIDYVLTDQTYLAKHPNSGYSEAQVLEYIQAGTDASGSTVSFSPNHYSLTTSALIADPTTSALQTNWYMLPIPQTIAAGAETIDDFNTEGANNYVAPGAWSEDDTEITKWLDAQGIAYIDVIYRMDTYVNGTSGETERFVGWEDAGDYYAKYITEVQASEYATMSDEELNVALAAIGSTNVIATTEGYTSAQAIIELADYANSDSQEWLDTYDNTPLFIRVGFGLPADYVLEPGNYYQFLLDFANHGGYFLDDHYYDVNGDRTDMPLPDEYVPGEPVINADAVISMTILVNAWNDAESQTLDGSYTGDSPDGEGQTNDNSGE